MKFLLLLLLISTAFAKHEILLSQDDVIWGFDFLSPKKIIFTLRSGSLKTFDLETKKVTTHLNPPKVYAVGQGGLLDVRYHSESSFIYITYSEPIGKNKSTTSVGKFKIQNDEIIDFKKIFSAHMPSPNDYHYGSRIEFDQKGHLFISIGERGERESVQDLTTHLGKIIRLNLDGSIPKDNPYVEIKNIKPEIWARGLRNPQGLSFRPNSDELWEGEFGPRGGDEINIIEPKLDYGWPVVTYGREYYGPKIGEGTSKPGVEEPIKYWVPSISPSAMTFYTGDKFPEWNGNLFLATLSGQHIRRLVLKERKVIQEEILLKDLNFRFRNIRTGPDGYLWFSTDEGKIGRIIK